jgi:hypothetical protein
VAASNLHDAASHYGRGEHSDFHDPEAVVIADWRGRHREAVKKFKATG